MKTFLFCLCMSGALFSCNENGRYVLYESTDTWPTRVFDTHTGRLYFEVKNGIGADKYYIDYVDEAIYTNEPIQIGTLLP
jgi:hypothetical protein